jgi:hypothetical protein
MQRAPELVGRVRKVVPARAGALAGVDADEHDVEARPERVGQAAEVRVC